jgi:hypothetical protein
VPDIYDDSAPSRPPLRGFYFGPALLLALVIFPGIPRPASAFLIVAGAVVIAGLTVEVFFLAHYAAPLTGICLALVVQAFRHLPL